MSSNMLKNNVKKCCAIAGLMSLLAGPVSAEAPDWQAAFKANEAYRATYVSVGEDYALGINKFDVDQHTEIIGWRLSQRWYFGRQDGLDSGLTFVWQQNDQQQVSVSKDGIRLTRRF